jgi:hypothetical protein
VELAQRLSTSSEGMSATAATHPGIRFTTVQGLLQITNTAGKFQLPLVQRACFLSHYIAPGEKFLKEKKLLNFRRTP